MRYVQHERVKVLTVYRLSLARAINGFSFSSAHVVADFSAIGQCLSELGYQSHYHNHTGSNPAMCAQLNTSFEHRQNWPFRISSL
jgi:hypothetical protein